MDIFTVSMCRSSDLFIVDFERNGELVESVPYRTVIAALIPIHDWLA